MLTLNLDARIKVSVRYNGIPNSAERMGQDDVEYLSKGVQKLPRSQSHSQSFSLIHVTYVAPFQPRAAMTCPPFKRFIGWAGVRAIPSYRNSEDSVDSLEVGESTTRYAILNPGRLNPLHMMSTILGGIDMYEGGGMANWRGKFFAGRYQATGKSSQL